MMKIFQRGCEQGVDKLSVSTNLQQVLFVSFQNNSVLMKNSLSPRKSNCRRPCEFIEKLMQMMKNHPDFVMWGEQEGRLKLAKRAEFQAQILPKFFRHSNMLSFVRQLNMYYFAKKEGSNDEVMEFTHDIFRRGNENQFHKIVRRNRFRDDAIDAMQNDMKDTLDIIRKEHLANPELKDMMEAAIEYQEITIKAITKIKAFMDELGDRLKNSRAKEIQMLINEGLRKKDQDLKNHIEQFCELQKFSKTQLARDVKDFPMPSLNMIGSQPLLFDELKTVKNLGKIMNFRSKDSLVFDNNKNGNEAEFEQIVSFEEGIQGQPEAQEESARNAQDIATGI